MPHMPDIPHLLKPLLNQPNAKPNILPSLTASKAKNAKRASDPFWRLNKTSLRIVIVLSEEHICDDEHDECNEPGNRRRY